MIFPVYSVVSSFPGPVRDSTVLQVCICTMIKCDSLSKLCLNYRMIFHVCTVVFSIPGPVQGHCGCVQLKSSNWKYKPKFWRVRAAEIYGDTFNLDSLAITSRVENIRRGKTLNCNVITSFTRQRREERPGKKTVLQCENVMLRNLGILGLVRSFRGLDSSNHMYRNVYFI